MKMELIVQLNKTVEESAYTKDGVEYWMARDIQKLLDYAEWRNFLLVVNKAKIACLNSGQAVSDHFVDVSKMIDPLFKSVLRPLKVLLFTQTTDLYGALCIIRVFCLGRLGKAHRIGGIFLNCSCTGMEN